MPDKGARRQQQQLQTKGKKRARPVEDHKVDDDTDLELDTDDFLQDAVISDAGPDGEDSDDDDEDGYDVDEAVLDASDEDDELLSDEEREFGDDEQRQQVSLAKALARRHAASAQDEAMESDDDDMNLEDDEGFDSNAQSDNTEKRPEIEPFTDSDDSDVEAPTNRVGNVPMEWYNDLPHIGYNVNGQKIMRPAVGDALDQFLSKMDDPDSWKSVHSKQDMTDTVLTNEELDIIQRIQKAEYGDVNFDPYQPTVEWFTSRVEQLPLSAAPEPKRRFQPSKWEALRVKKIILAIRRGWIVPRKPKPDRPAYHDIWSSDKVDEERPVNHPVHLPAPKRRLPGHKESYNPPEEYLWSEEEKKAWLAKDPSERRRQFMPQKYDSMRKIPAYNNFIQDQFERCLDLYLCPRTIKKRSTVNHEDLIPKLPNPKDLEPFPTKLSLTFTGHTSRIRSFSISPSGQFILSGSDDKTARLWEVATGRCLHKWQFTDEVTSVAWNPSRTSCTALIASGNDVYLVDMHAAYAATADRVVADRTAASLKGEIGKSGSSKVSWRRPIAKLAQIGVVWVLEHTKTVTNVTWHKRGDYFASVTPDAGHSSILIHQVSRRSSQQPFRKTKGLAIRVLFHPTKAHFFVATQRYVRVYDLQRQELIKKLISGVKWISSLDVHPAGENIIVGSYDKRLCWWDLELGVTPYRTLRYHKQALRSVCFHKRYPLFASSSDDGTIQLFHGMVYNDLLSNPLIVPVKVLHAHKPVDSLGALNIEWHPTQPWIISSGADGLLKLWI
ncbi:Ribosome biogenesis protein erb1 [Sorochytrium milnesiophthora]